PARRADQRLALAAAERGGCGLYRRGGLRRSAGPFRMGRTGGRRLGDIGRLRPRHLALGLRLRRPRPVPQAEARI
ncbi:hypothetical protein LTR94_037724, partial [Friedmanniomyces endolithicus]